MHVYSSQWVISSWMHSEKCSPGQEESRELVCKLSPGMNMFQENLICDDPFSFSLNCFVNEVNYPFSLGFFFLAVTDN